MVFIILGCKKNPECEDGYIPFLEFGCEKESELRKYIFFEVRPSFYCYNDYTVLALNLDEMTDFRANPSSRIYNNSFYYINPKLEIPRGGTRSFSLTVNEGLELCYASLNNDTPYYTHLQIRDPERIQATTESIQVNLLLKETSSFSSATLDSTIITMTRRRIF